MRRIQGVLFDKDGTLFDFQATWGPWTRGLIEEEAGGDPRRMRALARALGHDLATGRFRPDSPVIAGTVGTVADLLLPLLPGRDREALIRRMNDRAALAPQVEAVPLAPLLDRLRAAGLRLGLATNDAEGPARAHLEAAGVRDRFDFLAGYDSGYGGKPGTGQLLAFLRGTGLGAGQVAMVGDSLHDLHAAAAAGMVPVAVLTGPAPAAVLAPHAAAVLPSIAGLPGWLGLAPAG